MADKISAYAAEGTLAHSVAENKLKKRLLHTDVNLICEDAEMDEYTDDYVNFVLEQTTVLTNLILSISQRIMKLYMFFHRKRFYRA
ncbi:MAG: DUF2800 domain-containing protein [Christensenellaceae bacterium]